MSASVEGTPVEKARAIGREIARLHADDVDRQARFPKEAIEAVRAEGLLAASVPRELGGLGATVPDVVSMCQGLAQGCSATGMVFAMHHIKLLSMAAHAAGSDATQGYVREICDKKWLVASVTSEVGVGGDLRRSVCAVETTGDTFSIVKDATTISYGAQADGLLLTARRHPDSAPADQSLVWLKPGDYTLEQKSEWDTLGMRGTCSPPFLVRGKGRADQVLREGFGDIAPLSMVPLSHLLWGGVWLGIATEAVSRARAFVRAEARKNPNGPPASGLRLSELQARLQSFRTLVYAMAEEYNGAMVNKIDKDHLLSIGYALRLNNLKLVASTSVAEIVTAAMPICGIMGYKNTSPFSLGRLLRDSFSAQLMINNDRLHMTNAQLLQVYKDDS